MDFKQYEYVLMVAQEKNFSKAAKKLFISQPSLSQYISRIESDLGVILFNRNSNPLSLTYEGKLYVETATKIMALSKEMLKAFDDVKELKKGRLTVGLTPSKANHPLPSILPVFKKRYPSIDIKITEASSTELEELILSGKVDICIMNLPLTTENIAFEPIISERIFIAAPPDQVLLPEKEFSVIDIKDLKDEQFILLPPGLRLRQISNSVFSQAGMKPKVLIETRSIETSIRLAAAGLGFTFVPEAAALHSGLNKTPKYYVLGSPPLCWTLSLAYKQDAYIPKAALAFAEVTKEVLSQMYSSSGELE